VGTVTTGTAPLTRATDFDTNAEASPGAFTFVEQGTAQADSGWVHTTDGPVTLGTTALTFAQFSSAGTIDAGAGLTKTGNTIDVVGGTGILVTADAVAIDTALVTRKVTFNVGDGAATSYTLTHSFGTRDVQVQVYANAAPYDTVETDVERLDGASVVVRFATAPALNAYRAVVLG
jgi:hypothetical protein